MVISANERSAKKPAKQGIAEDTPEPIQINGSTHFDFEGKNLTAYGGLLPVATMLEKLKFQELVEETLTVKRVTRAMPWYQFVLSMVLALYVGFSRLHHLQFLAREPMLIGILKVLELPPQCTFWRFLASLHLTVAQQLLEVQRQMRQRVWEAANVKLTSVTFDTDTTVHTVYGKQMGARKSYNPKNKGKKSFQPILTFLAETKEFVGGELRNGNRPTGTQIAKHLESVMTTVPKGVKVIYGRADCGFYCWEAVQAYEKYNCQFIVVAQKTPRLLEELKSAHWKRSPRTDADQECEFRYRPQGWGRAYRFIALRYEKKPEPKKKEEPEQYQLFETSEYTYRVFVTSMDDPLDTLVWFYRQRATAENLIKEANNDAGLAAHPSKRWAMNCVHFQLAMLAYNLNCWLVLFNREKTADAAEMKHVRLSTTRLRFLFLAAKIWCHSGRVGVTYSDHYQEKGIFQRLMDRLRSITDGANGFAPVVPTALRC
jgi:Transposase DDE domain group 1